MLLNSGPVCLYLPQPFSLSHLYMHPVSTSDIDLTILVWFHHFIAHHFTESGAVEYMRGKSSHASQIMHPCNILGNAAHIL